MSAININNGTWARDPITGEPIGFLRSAPLVDRRKLTTGTAKYSFFTTPYDASVTPSYDLTNADTNMSEARVPASEKWYLFGMKARIIGVDTANTFTPITGEKDNAVNYLLANSWVKMTVREQEWFRMPASVFLGQRGYSVLNTSTSTVTAASGRWADSWNRGEVEFLDEVNMYAGKFGGLAPYILEGNTAFRLDFEVSRDAANTVTALNGYRVEFEFRRNVVGLSAA